jgi:threonyl-tRNA synthetase
VMVHRAIIGSVERAVAQLIEVHGGAFPTWLAPVQLVVLPISADEEPAAADVRRRAVELGLRVEVAHADEGSLGARIRENRLVPFQAVIGAREAAEDLVAVRLRSGERLDPAPVAAALDGVNVAAAPSAGEKVGKNV